VLCLTMEHQLISSHSVNRSILSPLYKFRYLTTNEKRKKPEKHSIGVHMSTISLVVIRNSSAYRQKDYRFKKNDSEEREMINQRVRILVDQDQLTGHPQGHYSVAQEYRLKLKLIDIHCHEQRFDIHIF
jgi:hypothetical protein